MDAQFNLGIMYYKGYGVNKNRVLAAVWSNIAASHGFNKKHIKFFKIISKEIDVEGLKMSHKLAIQCVKSNYKNCD
ncbi:hypothetical protein [Zooshikella sp. RANM57]|uniref:hypothetical protein n=1 Tax=Zooshikella sp. RANM57 TaxID=3425863 RepID=UPI003D6EC9AE